MIEYVRGALTEKELAQVAVEANGVGYEVIIPLSTYEQLPQLGAEVKLYTHFHVREDAQKLFGFFTKTERELFRQLIAVSSIGPKTAMSILSKISVDEFVRSVTTGDPSRLVKIPGVGLKTAQRLLVELRDKLKVIPTSTAPSNETRGQVREIASPASDEANAALISLGYNEKQVAKAIERVKQIITEDDAPVEEWIKKALQVI
jgi:Holliday junction DNA helicase RuvA